MTDLISSALAHRPSIQHTLMESAKLWSRRSTCARTEVGVVVVHEDNRILVTGYNGAPAGMPHCNHECICDLERYGDLVAKGHHLSLCTAGQPCTVAVHAEANAIAFAARNGTRLDQAMLYTTLSPCYTCAQLIINSGIVEVVYLMEYRVTDGLELLASAGVEVVRYTHGK